MPAIPLPSGLRIERLTVTEADDETLRPLLTLVNEIRAERQPRSIDFTLDEYRRFSVGMGSVRAHRVVIDDGGWAVAYLSTSYADDGSNPSLLDISIAVHRQHRLQGIARALLGEAVTAARELGRDTLTGEAYDTVPEAAKFLEAIGAEKTLDMHTNVVRIDDLDLDLLRTWEAAGPQRAPGYSVTIVEGMYPDEILERMVHLYQVLDRDSPRPEGVEPRTWTADLIADWLDSILGGISLITAIAVQDASGLPVGMSQLGRRHTDETSWFVTTTMVHPEHRGRSLGKWVKAASLLAAMEGWPRAAWMETTNAFTNEPMLAINHAMGFRHEYTVSEVELPVAMAENYLKR